MRVAALSDIHGNLPALEAVLADVERAAVDVIVVGGGRRGAFWALLGPDVELRHTEYDVDADWAAIRALDSPVEERLIEYLISPLDPHVATAEFESLRGA